MGELVVAAVVAHQPMIMLPQALRIKLGETGSDTTLVEPGFRLLRDHLATNNVDTLIIIDAHWATTVETAFAGADHFSGLYTSEEMPRTICDHPYDFLGAPALAAAVHTAGKRNGIPTVNVRTQSLHLQYPTINLVHHLRTYEQVLSVSVLQTGDADDYLAVGQAIRDGIVATDCRAAILASGGMSHSFWPVKVIGEHVGFGPEHVISDEARAFDSEMLLRWSEGDHVGVLDRYPQYRAMKPEGRFGHYLTMLGALGGAECTATGTQFSEYENAVGTGQVHVVFDVATQGN
jgi:3,4-dihydroxyphenylacetate 2,3-dioxygenase